MRDNGEIAAKFGALGAKSIENVMWFIWTEEEIVR